MQISRKYIYISTAEHTITKLDRFYCALFMNHCTGLATRLILVSIWTSMIKISVQLYSDRRSSNYAYL